MRINHNIAALNTYRQLSNNNTLSSKSLEKLSSGLRINRAGDDAAGLAISEKMRAQIRGLDQASRNAQDSISMIQTAEGSLSETHSILQRMRELAVQASNDTNTATDRNEIQKEINQLSSEINRIGNTTSFNTISLLNGNLIGRGFSGGASSLTNATTGLTMNFNGQTLAIGQHKMTVSAAAEALVDPADITVSSGMYTASGGKDAVFSGNASGFSITTSTSVATADWRLTYHVDDSGNQLSGGVGSITNATTGLTINVASGNNVLAAGAHTIEVTAVQTDAADVQVQKADITGTGVNKMQFSGDAILATSGVSSAAGAMSGVEITYQGSGLDVKFYDGAGALVFSDTIGINDTYNNHDISFRIENYSGIANGDKIWLGLSGVAANASGDFGTESKGYAGTNTGQNNWTFGAVGTSGRQIAVDDSVETGNYTITLLSGSQYRVQNSAGTVNDVWTIGSGAYSNHGITLNITASGSGASGDIIEFSVTDTYTVTYKLDGGGSGGYSGTLAGVTSATTLASTSTFLSGITVSGANLLSGLTEVVPGVTTNLSGTFTFNIEDVNTTYFKLSGGGINNQTVNIGSAFNDSGLNFNITSSGTMRDGDYISFATTAPTQTYTITMQLDGGGSSSTSGTITGASGGHTFTGNTSIAGLSIDGASLSSGSYTFNVENKANETKAAKYQIGANENQSMSLNVNDMRAMALNITSTVAGSTGFTAAKVVTDGTNSTEAEYALDVSTSTSAANAVTVINNAIETVSAERSKLGAYQNRLEHTINNLGTASENLTAAESRIRDVDMAKEMMEFTKMNILSQAAQAMLAQANQQPQGVLQLLR